MPNSTSTFPVLWPRGPAEARQFKDLGCPRVIPLAMLEAHQSQVTRNYGAVTLSYLASRGGLGPQDIVAILSNREYRSMSHSDAIRELLRLLKLGEKP